MMSRRTFWQALLDGFAAIGQGWFDIMDSVAGRRHKWRYEDHFGADEEQIQKDWEAIGNDMQAAIDDIIPK